MTDEEGQKPHKRKKTDGHKIPTKVIFYFWTCYERILAIEGGGGGGVRPRAYQHRDQITYYKWNGGGVVLGTILNMSVGGGVPFLNVGWYQHVNRRPNMTENFTYPYPWDAGGNRLHFDHIKLCCKLEMYCCRCHLWHCLGTMKEYRQLSGCHKKKFAQHLGTTLYVSGTWKKQKILLLW